MHRISAYIELAILFVIAAGIIAAPVLLIVRKKKGIPVLRQTGIVLFGCSVVLILFATIFYMPWDFSAELRSVNFIPFSWVGKYNTVYQFFTDKIPNIMMFIPFGFLLPISARIKRKFSFTLIAVFLFSFMIEFSQYFIGRKSDVDDLITNLLGGIIGYLFFIILNKLLKNVRWWKIITGNTK